MIGKRMVLGAILGFCAAPVMAGPWFHHEFGELRAYHQDFLTVCANDGAGPCRTVQYLFDKNAPSPFGKGFFGEARLAVHRLPGGGYGLEIFNASWPDDPSGPFAISVDGHGFDLPQTAWVRISPEGYNVAETISVSDPVLVADLLTAMKRGFFLRIESGDGDLVFSLSGLTASLHAIETNLKRQMQ